MTALPDRYAPYERLRAPALRRPALWRLALGAVLVVALWAGVGAGVFMGAQLLAGRGDPSLARELLGGDTPRAVLLLLATFLGLLAAPFAAARLLHGRRPPGLLGPRREALRDFWRAALVTAAAYALTLLAWAIAFDSLPGVPWGTWLALLPAAIVLLLVQTGAEEVAFRGYLQSQLAARFASPLVWIVLPSILFGAIHWDPQMDPANAATLALSAGLFGLVAADLTARTGTLGAAWGFHFANNFAALALLGTPGALAGLALRRAPYSLDEPLPAWLTLADLALIGLVWLALSRLLRRAPQEDAP